MLRFRQSHRSLRRLSSYSVGTHIHGYVVDQVQSIPEFSTTAIRLHHPLSGLQHLHLASPHDSNNVFSVALKTNPPDNAGVPHILEHMSLCGSKTYPVRDPFFKMLNRSLSNFMNAMTGHDYTYYPFATTNKQDFHNLMHVYLSAVFEPLLTRDDFLQEGWRLENADLADPRSPLLYKGVVYNEMKGQYSNTNYLFWTKFQHAVYPTLNNSGGDPAAIVDLDYRDLVSFHSRNYSPENARTFSYGSFPLDEHLALLNEHISSLERKAPMPSKALADQRWPIFAGSSETFFDVQVPGPVDAMVSNPAEEQYKSSLTWYLGDPLEGSKRYELFKWKALSSLLFDGHNAPLYQELIETGYAEDFSANSGLDATTHLLSFTIGLDKLSLQKSNELAAKFNHILSAKVLPEMAKRQESAFHDRILAIYHQMELGFKKHKPDLGLSLLNSIVPTWVNGQDPVATLQVQDILTRFKQEYTEKGLGMFEDMIKDTLLNPSTPVLKFTMVPDPEYNTRLASEEKSSLDHKVESLSEGSKKEIFDSSRKLLEAQQKEEDLSVLPTVTMDDIPRKGTCYELAFSSVAGSGGKIQKRVVPTNDLVYVTATKDLAFLPEHLYKYLPLFSTCLTNLAGTQTVPITSLENKIQTHTGGISFSTSVKSDPFDISKTHSKFVVSGMALRQNAAHIYDLWYDILVHTKFSPQDVLVVEKLHTLVKNMVQNQTNAVADRGHSYASSYSSLKLTPTKYINNLMGGIDQVRLIMDINRKLDERGRDYLTDELLPILQTIQKHILEGYSEGHTKGFDYSVVGEAASVAENETLICAFDAKMASQEAARKSNLQPFVDAFRAQKLDRTILNMPFQVGYASLAQRGAPYASKDGASLQVLSQLMTFRHLHSVIRESNGAYGGGLNYDGLSGTLNFYSYRDPNAVKSAQAFAESWRVGQEKLMAGKWDEKVLQEAKIAIFQSVDAPSHISSQGLGNFLEGISDEMKQQRRERFLDVSLQDLQDVNEKYLENAGYSAYTIIGDAKTLNADHSWAIKSL